MRIRLALATALALPPLAAGAASADLHDDCWNAGLGFRVSALVCNKIPPGIG